MANLGTLAVNLTANASQFQRGLMQAQRDINGFATKAQSSLSVMAVSVGSAIGNLAASAVRQAMTSAMQIVDAGIDLGKHFLVTASSAEQLQAQLNVLAGSVKAGTKLFADLEDFAIRTSFSFEDVVIQARAFSAVGLKNNELIPTLTMIGTLAMGDTERMKLLGKAYTDVMNRTKLAAQETNQFAESNVNIIGALVEMYKKTGVEMGKTTAGVIKMREEGLVTFQDVHNALLMLVEDGGRFDGLLNKMMDTTAGKWQAFTERLDKISREFGEKLLPKANQFLDFLDKSMPKIESFADKMSDGTVRVIGKLEAMVQVIEQRVLPAFDKMQRPGGGGGWLDWVGEFIPGFAVGQGIGEKFGGMVNAQDSINQILERNRPKARGGNSGPPLPLPEAFPPIMVMPPQKPFVPSNSPLDMAASTIGLPVFSLLGQLGDETAKLLDAADAVKTPEQKKKEQERIAAIQGAGVAERGSQMAFSSIINAMRGNKDPNVQATNNVAHILQQEVVPAMEAVAANTQQAPTAIVELVG